MEFKTQFEEIRKDRIGVVNSSVYPGLKEFVSGIYPDEAHFIYELLQNAEDAGATEVRFEIKKTKLIFAHNGKAFDAHDVNAITNIAQSTKKGNYVQAGKFGIGFKSVYAFTEEPSIYCDTVNFKIEKLLLPTMIDELKSREDGWTEFHLPFNSSKIKSDNARTLIRKGLLDIEQSTLLFLNNISVIRYVLDDGTKCRVEKEVHDHVVTSSIYHGKSLVSSITWMRFSRDISIHGKSAKVDVAFVVNINEDGEIEFIPSVDNVSITFLAKNERSNLKIHINAPFGCLPSRDAVNKNDNDNKRLISEIAKLMGETLLYFRDNNLMQDSLFEVLPIAEDAIPEFYQPVVNGIYEAFAKQCLIPTVDDSYVSSSNGILSSRTVINKIFSIEDIQYIYENKKMQFVKNRPLNTRAYKFLKELHIHELTSINVLRKLTKSTDKRIAFWLRQMDVYHLMDVYSYLNKGLKELIARYDKYKDFAEYRDDKYAAMKEYYEEYRSAVYAEVISKELDEIRALKIIKDSSGSFRKADELRILRSKMTLPANLYLVEKKFLNRGEVQDFLSNMGVKEYDIEESEQYQYEREIVDFEKRMHSITQNTDPVAIARRILQFLDSHSLDEVDISDVDYIWTETGKSKGKKRIVSPADCYLDAPYVDATGFGYAEKIHKKYALNKCYLKLEPAELDKWLEYLKSQGILYSFDIKQQSIGTGYSTGWHLDYFITNLKEYLEVNSPELNKLLWHCLSDKWSDEYSFERKKLNQRASEEVKDSTVLRILKKMNWVATKSGELCSPAKVSEDNIANGWTVVGNEDFLKAIDFSLEKKQQDDAEKRKEELKRLQRESEQQAAAMLGFSSAQDVLVVKEKSQIFEELEKYGVDIRALLETKKKEKRVKKYSIQEQLEKLKTNEFVASEVLDDGEVYGVKNTEKRKVKIKEKVENEEAPKKKVEARTTSEIIQEERQFVGIEYSGRCQICDKIIYKKDGSRYYIAANLLDTGHLKEKYLRGLSTGWNTLCLCPNCNAEYKYGAVSLFDFVEKVKSTLVNEEKEDFYLFEIEMQGAHKKIKYTPKHLLALQTALKVFEEKSGK